MNQEEEIKKYLLPYQTILKLTNGNDHVDSAPMIVDNFISHFIYNLYVEYESMNLFSELHENSGSSFELNENGHLIMTI